MTSCSVHVTLGPLTRIEGELTSVVATQLKRLGAFPLEDSWFIKKTLWPNAKRLLLAAGVHIQEDGDTTQRTRISMEKGRLTMTGYMPRRMRKHWLGHRLKSGYVGFTPYALTEILETLESEGVEVELTDEVVDLHESVEDMMADATLVHLGDTQPNVRLASGTLWEHQRTAVGLSQAAHGRVYVLDEPGVGKTLSAIAMKRERKATRVLVITPAVAKGNWRDEVRRFDDRDAVIIDGQRPRPLPLREWYIINPELLPHRLEQLVDLAPDMVVVDEAHRFKGASAKRSSALMRLAHDARYFVGLTGTPIPNRLIDIWVMLHCIQPGWWGTSDDFGMAFCDPQRNHWASNKAGRFIPKYEGTTPETLPYLKTWMSAFTIRRRLEDVRDVPPQTRTVYRVPLPPKARKAYDDAVQAYRQTINEALDDVPESKHEEALQKLIGVRSKHAMDLRRISSQGRIQGTVELAQTYIEQGEHPVVFAYFRDTVDALSKAFGKHKVGVIHGGTTRQQRDEVRDAFNEGRLDALVCQVQAGGVAINLDQGSRVSIAHEITYEPIHIKQSEGRIYRATQTKPVQHIYMVGEDTMDETVVEKVLAKVRDIGDVLDEGSEENSILADFEAGL